MSKKSRKRKLAFVSLSKDESRDCANETPSQTDWTRCMFFQELKTETLVNPTESKQRSNCKQTFDSLEEDFRKFEAEDIGDITVSTFCDVGQSYSETCLLHHAKFHKRAETPLKIIIFKGPRRK